MGLTLSGRTPTEIVLGLQLERSTVQYTIVQDLLRHEGQSITKVFRGRAYTDAEEYLPVRHTRLHPKNTCAQLIEACKLGCEKQTVRFILAKHHITN
jgi:hypothetical protein